MINFGMRLHESSEDIANQQSRQTTSNYTKHALGTIGLTLLLWVGQRQTYALLRRSVRGENVRPNPSKLDSVKPSEFSRSTIDENLNSLDRDFALRARKLVGITDTMSEVNKSAFICITGQLSRLELENKIRTLMEPLHGQGYNIDVALVLSEGEPKFTNKAADEKRYDSLKDALKVFKNLSYVRVLNPNFKAYSPIPNPNPPAVYYMSLKKVDERPFEEVLERTESHVRIFDSYQRCWDLERKDAFANRQGALHDLYIRIREDVGLSIPVNMTMLNEFTTFSHTNKPKLILVTDCRSWGGINDRMAIVSPAAAQEYFWNPLEVMAHPYRGFGENGMNHVDWSTIWTPESLLKQVYVSSGMHIIQSKFLRSVRRIVIKEKIGEKIIDGYHPGDWKAFCPEDM